MKVANYIQLARTQLHLTQEYLAENIGVSRQAISRWENGQAQPSARNMVKIAALLNVSVDQLTGAAPLEPPVPAPANASTLTDDLMESWTDLFQRTMGVDLSRYAPEHIRQTVQNYMQQHDLRSVSSFVRLMSASKERRMEFLHAIQPPAPTFFDDPAFYRYIQEELLPRIHTPGTPIRVWALSAADGQEAFSLAMAIAEFQEQSNCSDSVRIFATDAAYLEAHKEGTDGFFTPRQVASILQALLEKYLIPVEGGFQICADIRKMVVFSPYDPLIDPPFSTIELVCCRRLVSILCPSCQARLIQTLYHSLIPSGCLLLPSSHPLTDGHMHFSANRDCPGIWHKLDDEDDICWEYGSCLVSSHQSDGYPLGVPIHRILQQFFVMHYPNALLIDENFRIVFVGEDIFHRFHLDQQGYSGRLADHVSGDLMQRIQLSAHRLQVAADPKRVNQTLIRLNETNRTMYMRMAGALVEKRWYYLVAFYDYRPQNSARDADKRSLEQQLMDTESNLKNKLQELVRAQDQIEVLNEKINSLNHALSNRSWEVRSLQHEVDLLNQELSRLHDQNKGLIS